MEEVQFAIMFKRFFQKTRTKFESLSIDSYKIQRHPTVLNIKKTSLRIDNFLESHVLTYYNAKILLQYFGSISES